MTRRAAAAALLAAALIFFSGVAAGRASRAASPAEMPPLTFVPVHVPAADARQPVVPTNRLRSADASADPTSTPGLILDPAQPTIPVAAPGAVAPTSELVTRSKPVVVTGASVADARAYALAVLGAAQYACLDALIARESGWNPLAYNASSGAYGLGQAVPGSKMAAYGADWATSAVTQVRFVIGYCDSRYGSVCSALAFQRSAGWY